MSILNIENFIKNDLEESKTIKDCNCSLKNQNKEI